MIDEEVLQQLICSSFPVCLFHPRWFPAPPPGELTNTPAPFCPAECPRTLGWGWVLPLRSFVADSAALHPWAAGLQETEDSGCNEYNVHVSYCLVSLSLSLFVQFRFSHSLKCRAEKWEWSFQWQKMMWKVFFFVHHINTRDKTPQRETSPGGNKGRKGEICFNTLVSQLCEVSRENLKREKIRRLTSQKQRKKRKWWR